MSVDDIENGGSTYQSELVKNYDELRASRDWSQAQMAEHLDNLDPALAAQYREAFGSGKSEAPKARKTAAKSEA
jgi:hypothetical protein